MDRYSDQQLMDLVRQHDEEAYTEIYKRYNGVLFVHALRMLDSEEEAKDVVQDLFVVLWQRRGDIKIRGSLSAYLYSAVRNRILDQISRSRTHDRYIHSLASFIAEGVNGTDHLVREKELSQIIEREVALLPDRMQHIFRLSRSNELSHKEIAEKMNLSDKTVKKQISNALIILRKKLDIAFAVILFLLH